VSPRCPHNDRKFLRLDAISCTDILFFGFSCNKEERFVVTPTGNHLSSLMTPQAIRLLLDHKVDLEHHQLNGSSLQLNF